jgi:hypothetical protein
VGSVAHGGGPSTLAATEPAARPATEEPIRRPERGE